MRSMWNGVISFGLVNIPVGLYPATKENQISFHLLHKKDCGRIKNQRVCSVCGETLDYDELVKGYEYERGEYVTVTDEDMKKVMPEASDNITIHGFVDLDDIDPIFFDSPYYLVPDKRSDRVYSLLREALKKSNKVGIASFVLRTREYLASIHPHENALILNTMHYADEIRPAEGMPAGEGSSDSREMAMAIQLIEAMGEGFEPGKYKDTYNEELLALIQTKLAGKPLKAKAAPKEPTNVLDLMSRLKASLEKAGKPDATTTEAAPEAPPKKPRATKAKTGPKAEKSKPALKMVA